MFTVTMSHHFYIKSGVLDQNCRAPFAMYYAGLLAGPFGLEEIAGIGCCRDSVSPFAFGINHALDSLASLRGANRDDRLPVWVFAKNKAVTRYVRENVPAWRNKDGLNGKRMPPEGRDEWYKIANGCASGDLLIDTAFVIGKGYAPILDTLLGKLNIVAAQRPMEKIGHFSRVSSDQLAHIRVTDADQ